VENSFMIIFTQNASIFFRYRLTNAAIFPRDRTKEIARLQRSFNQISKDSIHLVQRIIRQYRQALHYVPCVGLKAFILSLILVKHISCQKRTMERWPDRSKNPCYSGQRIRSSSVIAASDVWFLQQLFEPIAPESSRREPQQICSNQNATLAYTIADWEYRRV